MPVEPNVCRRRPKATPRREDLANTGWIDRVAVDRCGREVGAVVALYRSPHNAEPLWLGIDVGGIDELRIVVAPAQRAHLDGGVVVVDHDYEDIVTTPRVVVALMAAAIDHAE